MVTRNKGNRGTEVDTFTDADMQPVANDASLMSWQELMDAGAVHVQDIDDRLLLDKERLVGQPMMLISWEFKTGSLGEYAVVEVKTPNGSGVFADGSTGIMQQLLRYEQLMQKRNIPLGSPIYVPSGLRASHYLAKVPNAATGEITEIPAVTYYIDNKDG